MDHNTRFHRIMNFQEVDRIPMMEYAPWWHLTLNRWRQEGLPSALCDDADIRRHLGLDPWCHWWHIPYQRPGCPQPMEGHGLVTDMDSYLKLRPFLFPDDPFPAGLLEKWREAQSRGELVVWFTLCGFFSMPRFLFGIEAHLFSFYDHPEVMHAINADTLAFNLRVLDRCLAVVKPDFVAFFEDMSYNLGPMCSEEQFKTHIAPWYRQMTQRLKELDIIPFVDSDGKIDLMVPWFADAGVDGFFPLERQAGVDIVAYRKQFPRLRMMGAFDKLVVKHGETAIRNEFERILPVMKQGGYIPCTDHQVPPEVSLEQYRVYLHLLNEYCKKAMSGA